MNFLHKSVSFSQAQIVCYCLVHRCHLPVASPIRNKTLSNILQEPLLTLQTRYFSSNQTEALLLIAQYYVLQYFYHITRFLEFPYNQDYHSVKLAQVYVLPQSFQLFFPKIHLPKHKSTQLVL